MLKFALGDHVRRKWTKRVARIVWINQLGAEPTYGLEWIDAAPTPVYRGSFPCRESYLMLVARKEETGEMTYKELLASRRGTFKDFSRGI